MKDVEMLIEGAKKIGKLETAISYKFFKGHSAELKQTIEYFCAQGYKIKLYEDKIVINWEDM